MKMFKVLESKGSFVVGVLVNEEVKSYYDLKAELVGTDRTKKMPYSIEELAKTSDSLWFSKGAMSFFKTRLSSEFKRIDDKKAYFVSTEKGPSGVRKASVRVATIVDSVRDDGDIVSAVKIDTVGEFNSMSLAEAKTALKKLSK